MRIALPSLAMKTQMIAKVRSSPRTLSWFATMTSTRRGECVDYVTAGRGPIAQGLLARSLEVLESADHARIPDVHARLAFWINAYNTLVYAAALDAVSKSPSALISEGASMCYEPLDSRSKATWWRGLDSSCNSTRRIHASIPRRYDPG